MGMTILIVDDSTITRRVVARTLRTVLGSGLEELVEVSSAKEALEQRRLRPFDLLFTDLTMPGMTGYELLETLSREGLTCTTVVLSADVQPKAVERVKALGASEFLPKPPTEASLRQFFAGRGLL